MRMYLLCEGNDTRIGLRLAGIEGVVINNKQELVEKLSWCLAQRDIGVLLISEKLAAMLPDKIKDIKLNANTPLIVEIPDIDGSVRRADSITRYIKEAIGIKLN